VLYAVDSQTVRTVKNDSKLPYKVRSSKFIIIVINLKRTCNFLLTNNSKCGPKTPFRRIGDVEVENCRICPPVSDLTPPLGALNDTGIILI